MMTIRAVIAAVVLAVFCVGAGTTSATAAAQTAKLARDPELIDAGGYARLLAANRGAPLVVTFWATWCEPCRDEYPMLNELAKQYGTQGLKVVGVSLDDDGDLILVRRFLARYKPVFPNYRKKPGSETEFAQFRGAVLAGWSGSLPVTLFFSKDGRMVGKVMGEGTRETYEADMKALLAGN
jgi:thiol-disulfide isomerase/thioredoxin